MNTLKSTSRRQLQLREECGKDRYVLGSGLLLRSIT